MKKLIIPIVLILSLAIFALAGSQTTDTSQGFSTYIMQWNSSCADGSDVSILFYDAPTSGNLVDNQTFASAVTDSASALFLNFTDFTLGSTYFIERQCNDVIFPYSDGYARRRMDTNPFKDGMSITNEGIGNGILIDQDGDLNGGSALRVLADTTAQTNWQLVRFEQTNAGSSATNLLVANEGTGSGLLIDQNGNGIALSIDSEATSVKGLSVDTVSSDVGFYAKNTHATGGVAYLYNPSGTGNVLEINNAGTGDAIFVDQNGDGDAIVIDSAATSPTAEALTVYTSSGANGILIDQDGNAVALNIDSESTSVNVVNIEHVGAGAGLRVAHSDGSTTQLNLPANNTITQNWFYRNVAAAGTESPFVFIENDNAGDTQPALKVQQDGTGSSLFLDQNGAQVALYVDNDGGSSGIQVSQSTGTGGAIISQNAGTGAGVQIEQVGNGKALYIQNTGTANGIFVEQNGDGTGMYIDTDTTTKYGMYILSNNARTTVPLARIKDDHASTNQFTFEVTSDGTAQIGRFTDASGANEIRLASGGASTEQRTLYAVRNLAAAATSAPMFEIIQDNAGDDQQVLSIIQDGTGEALRILGTAGTQRTSSTPFVKIFNSQNDSGSFWESTMLLQGGNVATQTSPIMSIYSYASNDQKAISIENNGAGDSIFIDTNGNANSIEIDSEATTEQVLRINAQNTGARVVSIINGADSDSAVMYLSHEHASTTGGIIEILNVGTGNSIFIDQNGNGIALNIDSEATSANAVVIDNVGTGSGLFLDQNGNGIALSIDSESTSTGSIAISSIANDAWLVDMIQLGAVGTEVKGFQLRRDSSSEVVRLNSERVDGLGTNSFYRNLAAAYTNGSVVGIIQDNAGDDQPALRVKQDAPGVTAVYIEVGTTNATHMHLHPFGDAPATCAEGDVYTDTSGAFCYCYTTDTWENLGTNGACV